jgi:LPXTG-motif cell wall-anchored protein
MNGPVADEKKIASVGQDNQTLMLGGGALLLIAAILLFIIRKKRRSKNVDFSALTQTRIE